MEHWELIGKVRRYKCKYCGRLYIRCGAWMMKHFAKHHTGMKRSVKEVFVPVKSTS